MNFFKYYGDMRALTIINFRFLHFEELHFPNFKLVNKFDKQIGVPMK